MMVDVPAGTLVISTPYTADNPFELGTLLLNSTGTGLFASAPFGGMGALTITDSRPDSPGWTAAAQTTDFVGAFGNGTPIDGNNLSFTDVLPSYLPGNALADGSVLTSPIDHFKDARKAFASTTEGPGTVGITGELGLTAPTSTEPGRYTATITFTVV
jgi:hypothetical protein